MHYDVRKGKVFIKCVRKAGQDQAVGNGTNSDNKLVTSSVYFDKFKSEENRIYKQNDSEIVKLKGLISVPSLI